jgi:predicted AAA+ superfamily ATPase
VNRVLLTGMSGTGKSSVIRALARVLDDLQAVEPLLRMVATHEIRTTRPLADVVTEILHLTGAWARLPGS